MSQKLLGKRNTNESTENSHIVPKKLKRDNSSQVVPELGSHQYHVRLEEVDIPKYGTNVERNKVRKAGPFIIGHEIGANPAVPVIQYLCRKEHTNEFFVLKILTYDTGIECTNKESLQGKILIHTEFSLLSLLSDLDGVIHNHGLFSDYAFEEKTIEKPDKTIVSIYTGRIKRRIILVLDCVYAHEFCEQSSAFVNLQKYVSFHKFSEIDAILLFYEIVKVVESLHERNIIHRDLKLNNIVLNRRTNKITITNFFLGKHLNHENDNLYDQRGSPAYISPDVLGGKPYKGKPSDIWALGVVLYTIIYGKFPFVDTTPSALFKKIRQADFIIPIDHKISEYTNKLIKAMLTLNPDERLTATEVRYQLEKAIDRTRGPKIELDQVVPEASDNNDEEYDDRIPFKKVYPKHEFSKKPFSHILETLPHKRENENFIKPRLLSIQRVGSNLRPVIQQSSRNAPINNEVFSWSSSRNNSQFTGRVSAAHEIRSGSIVRSDSTANPDLFEIRIAPTNDANNISTSRTISNETNASDRLGQQIVMRVDAQSINQIINNNVSNSLENSAIQGLYASLNEMFTRGRIPAPSRDNNREFQGIITMDIANKIIMWLLANFRNNEIVRDIFGNSIGNKINNVLELLRRFGVQMETINGNILIKKEQTLDLLMFMTFLLQIAGYNNNYFLTMMFTAGVV